jgi:cobalt/nickel transport system permease protein
VHHVALEHWAHGASALHRRDARAKILALLAFLVVLATTPSGAAMRIAAYAVVALAAVLIARLPLGGLLGRATVVLPFALTFAAVSWFAGDHPRAIALVEKTYLSTVAVLVVAGTTPLPALLQGFESLGAPRVLVSVIQFLYRYLFVISEQAQHMRLAAACRAGIRKTGRRTRFQAAAGALSVLFARSYFRADGIHRSMLSRGYNGQLPVADPERFKIADAAFAMLVVLTLAGLRVLPY